MAGLEKENRHAWRRDGGIVRANPIINLCRTAYSLTQTMQKYAIKGSL